MAWLTRLRYRLRTLTGRDALEAQLDAELQFHLEMQTSVNLRLGLSPVAARRLAQRQFGSVARHKDEYRDRWSARRLETLFQDARAAVRHGWAHRGTSLAVILVLALGIGAGTSVLEVLYSVVLNPLPLSDPGQLVRLQVTEAPEHTERLLSAPEVRDLRAHVASLESVAEFHYMYFILFDGDEPQRVSAGVVSANFFDVIGVTPMLGRGFAPHEEQPGAGGVIVVSHRYWQERLGGDPNAIGRTFQMNDREHTLVGVLPPLPSFPEEADVYLPTAACPLRISPAADGDRSMRLVSALGRMSRDRRVNVEAVQRDLASLVDRLRTTEPSAYAVPPAMSAVPVQDDLTGRFRPTLSVLVASTVFLLLSLCLSVAALMVATTLRRRDTLLLMTALGAWRGRLFRQFAAEALVLSSAGAVAGMFVASQTVPMLAGLAARFTPRAVEIQFNQSSIGFAAVVTILIGLLIGGIVTATAASSLSATDGLGHRRHVSTRPRLFKTLVVVHIAVSFALLVGAGLMVRSLLNLERVPTGYRSENVLTLRVSADFIQYPTPATRAGLLDRLVRAIEAIPGVASVGVSGALPLVENGNAGEDTFEIWGRMALPRANRPLASLQTVSPGYFDAVGLDPIEGRAFSTADRIGTEPVVVVNQTMARRHWGASTAAGARIRVGEGQWATVVGVVPDARQRLAEVPMDEIYAPLGQLPTVHGLPSDVQVRFFVRGTLAPAALEAAIRDAVRAVEPKQAIDSVQPMEQTREQSLAPMRLTTGLIGLFAVIALSISAIGLCGVAGASVSVRTRAFGLQMALGAPRRRLLFGVLREGVTLGAAGLVLGLAFTIPLTRALRGLLFEVGPQDPATFATVAALLLVMTVCACFAPARRASRIDPNVALRA